MQFSPKNEKRQGNAKSQTWRTKIFLFLSSRLRFCSKNEDCFFVVQIFVLTTSSISITIEPNVFDQDFDCRFSIKLLRLRFLQDFCPRLRLKSKVLDWNEDQCDFFFHYFLGIISILMNAFLQVQTFWWKQFLSYNLTARPPSDERISAPLK